MENFESFEQVLYDVNEQTFDEIALKLFQFQAKYNPVYSQYIRFLGVNPLLVGNVDDIPFLPVSFFKNHTIKTGVWQAETTFTSSGTTGMISSRHEVYNLQFYLDNAARCFSFFYGNPYEYSMLALLPSYAERSGSSLIAMMENFRAGFYHKRPEDLVVELKNLNDKKVILWGVTYALLDLADQQELDLSRVFIMETGGMKGKRKEITRAELHEYLGRRFHAESIHSEYGMTELLSQAYSAGNGHFRCPPWMRVLLRDPEDPRDVSAAHLRGGINIIDLANIRTCAFIETQDLGKMGERGSFEVLGRMDNSDIRGCNLLVE
ncbi:MAG TPA: acyl transferase [Cyclobacteriaceae bacterium]|nr:acyl transferase [Cyclobacteriaceae bacterium]